MAHAVFIQNPKSIYNDRPGIAYHFPRRYLGMVKETVGDWVIFYEGRKGAFGYTAVQKSVLLRLTQSARIIFMHGLILQVLGVLSGLFRAKTQKA